MTTPETWGLQRKYRETKAVWVVATSFRRTGQVQQYGGHFLTHGRHEMCLTSDRDNPRAYHWRLPQIVKTTLLGRRPVTCGLCWGPSKNALGCGALCDAGLQNS